jgi:hypothetical protein
MVKHGPLVLEYSQITPHIYIGTNRCCRLHFEKSLLRKGIRADISLEEKSLDQPFGVNYYLWLPTKDHTAPSQGQLAVGTDFLMQLVRRRIKCYVHCMRGHGRTPALVAAYLVMARGVSPEQAFALIKKVRPSVHPNKKQVSAVKRFAAGLNNNRPRHDLP